MNFASSKLADGLSKNRESRVDLVITIPADNLSEMDILVTKKRLQILVDRLLALADLLDQRGVGETTLLDRHLFEGQPVSVYQSLPSSMFSEYTAL